MEERAFVWKLLQGEDVVSDIRANQERLLLAIPELGDMIDFAHCHPHHHLDVFEHTLLALSFAQNEPKTRLALLLHDIGKPHCYQQEGEIRHYRGHAEKSAEMAKAILKRLGFEAELVQSITEIVHRHDTPLCETDFAENERWAKELFAVQKCDALAHEPAYNQKRMAYIKRIERLMLNEIP